MSTKSQRDNGSQSSSFREESGRLAQPHRPRFRLLSSRNHQRRRADAEKRPPATGGSKEINRYRQSG
ncbi:hypothetical protein FPOA_11917 [Fusarium poae]|uniref:Uncharacterized protein n=1 Tax=Fusarium poae TaxID=36050 RepID=A0A1B8AI08_FUSPO|nr:hypothetical protein FPOA_11917 [Fusarium poae]